MQCAENEEEVLIERELLHRMEQLKLGEEPFYHFQGDTEVEEF